MVEIGGRPLLWHIIQIYSACGFNEFIIALGYKGEVIKEYFLHFHAMTNDITLDLSTGGVHLHSNNAPPWKVHLVDTGDITQTGGRIKRLKSWLNDETFMMSTYGDGVAAIDVRRILEFHKKHGKLATLYQLQFVLLRVLEVLFLTVITLPSSLRNRKLVKAGSMGVSSCLSLVSSIISKGIQRSGNAILSNEWLPMGSL